MPYAQDSSGECILFDQIPVVMVRLVIGGWHGWHGRHQRSKSTQLSNP